MIGQRSDVLIYRPWIIAGLAFGWSLKTAQCWIRRSVQFDSPISTMTCSGGDGSFDVR
jgi:hypothetical protein